MSIINRFISIIPQGVSIVEKISLQDWDELYQERAAIMEYEANIFRKLAEYKAQQEIDYLKKETV